MRPWLGNRPKGHKKKNNRCVLQSSRDSDGKWSFYSTLSCMESWGGIHCNEVENFLKQCHVCSSIWVQSMEGGTKNNK